MHFGAATNGGYRDNVGGMTSRMVTQQLNMRASRVFSGRRLSFLVVAAVVIFVGILIWSSKTFGSPRAIPDDFFDSAYDEDMKLGRIWHKSCSARYAQHWDADLPRHTDETRWSQCMLPSPSPLYEQRDTEWAEDEPWRKKEAEELSKIVQHELHSLQNPSNCDAARLLLCSFDQDCGMGCKLHHVTHCLALAYATKRMMLMVESGFPYQKASWWGTHFRPLSDTCDLSHFRGVKEVEWTESTALGPHRKVFVPLVSNTKWLPALYPVAVPRHLSQRLFRLHCAPHVWWVGQLMAFLTRPAPKLQARLDRVRAQIAFRKPIVGLHVRHSDKAEGARHWPLLFYMPHVTAYFRHSRPGPKRVYLATDNSSLPSEALRSYSQYQWSYEETGTKTADLRHRYNSQALESAILDLLLLADTDYLICTFSSNVCRAAYELLQTKFADASWRVTSLDHPYYLHGQRDFLRTAIEEQRPRRPKEMTLTRGDPVSGFTPKDTVHCQGRNERTRKEGLYLASKVLLQTPVADFPTLRLGDSTGQ